MKERINEVMEEMTNELNKNNAASPFSLPPSSYQNYFGITPLGSGVSSFSRSSELRSSTNGNNTLTSSDNNVPLNDYNNYNTNYNNYNTNYNTITPNTTPFPSNEYENQFLSTSPNQQFGSSQYHVPF